MIMIMMMMMMMMMSRRRRDDVDTHRRPRFCVQFFKDSLHSFVCFSVQKIRKKAPHKTQQHISEHTHTQKKKKEYI